MSMFPGPGATIYRNEAGEVLGWDYPGTDDPSDLDDWRGPSPAYCKACGHCFGTDEDLQDEDLLDHQEVCHGLDGVDLPDGVINGDVCIIDITHQRPW